MMLAKIYLLLGEVSVASKTDPCRWHRSMEEWLAKVQEPERSDMLEEDTTRLLDRALERPKTCPASRQDRVAAG